MAEPPFLDGGYLREIDGVLYARRSDGRGWQRLRLSQVEAEWITHPPILSTGLTATYALTGMTGIIPRSWVVSLSGTLQHDDAFTAGPTSIVFAEIVPPGVVIQVKGMRLRGGT